VPSQPAASEVQLEKLDFMTFPNYKQWSYAIINPENEKHCLEEAEAIYGHVTSLHVYQPECFK